MGNWTYSLGIGLLGLITATGLDGVVQNYVSAHPAIAIVLSSICAIIGHVLPSPAVKQ